MTDITQAKVNIAAHNRANPYVDITPYELKVGFPKIKYSGFFPQAGEIVIYAVPSASFKDKEQIVGYTGRTAGASVRVAKGLTVRTGGTAGQPIRDTVRKHSVGDLIITNKRVVFIGKDDNFDYPVSKISAIKPLTKDTFVIQAGNNSKNIYVDAGATIYAAGFINYVVTAFNDGLDVINEVKQTEASLTSEQKAVCDNVCREVALMSTPVPTNKKKPKGCLTRVMMGVLFFFVAILVGVIIYAIALSGPQNGVKSDGSIVGIQPYSDSEILYKENHPLINDTFNTTKDFYSDVNKDKVKVISVAEHAAIERKLHSVTDDTAILYFIRNSTETDYIGTIQINLFSTELTQEMCIEKAVDLLTDYLPANFANSYDQDSCYRYTNQSVDVYTYSCRLNEHGKSYNSNNGGANLSPYYFLRFIHFTETNQWKLETGYAAFGDKDKGWIEKYANAWDIDMKDYLCN